MIRIFTSNEGSATTIAVDGQLVGDYVDAVEAAIHEAMGQQRPVHLFLRDVSNIDEHGRALLSRLAAKGVELSACGLYSSYLITEILRETAESKSGIGLTRNGSAPKYTEDRCSENSKLNGHKP